MAEFVHTDAAVIPSELMDNYGDKVEAEDVIKNIGELFKRDDIKQFNALIESKLIVPVEGK